MTPSDNTLDDNICEQLCAYMDGELPEAEARFLLRRLEHDDQLRAKWQRLQLASSCLKGQQVRPMRAIVCDQFHAALASPANAQSSHRPLWGWAVAASLLLAAVMFAPRLTNDVPNSASVLAAHRVPPVNLVPSLSSADLIAPSEVAVEVPTVMVSTNTASSKIPATANRTPTVTILASNTVSASALESPLPLSVQTPADFPLVDNGEKRTWPRSSLAYAANDPALEAYLVRHNQMMSEDGLGGFLPYVDVVANDQDNGSPYQNSEDSGQ